MTTLLETVHDPADLRGLAPDQLPVLAEEIRAFLVEKVCAAGGHLAAACADADAPTHVHTLGLPTLFLDAGPRADLLAAHGLTGPAIADLIRSTPRLTASMDLLTMNGSR